MRTNILTLLVGFVVMCGLVLLFKIGLDKMSNAEAAPTDSLARVDLDLNRRAILYRVRTGDTLWSLADRFYGNGHRWDDISRANELPAGQGLQTGAVIKIPLGPTDATPLVENQPPEPEPAVAAVDLAPSGRFAITENTVGFTHLRVDDNVHPLGIVCVARSTERGTVTLHAYSAADGDTHHAQAIAIYESGRGMALLEIRAEDFDADGVQELYTIWQPEGAGPLSRILRLEGQALVLVCETPDDPVALARLRARESR